jgi:hypothetical protein
MVLIEYVGHDESEIGVFPDFEVHRSVKIRDAVELIVIDRTMLESRSRTAARTLDIGVRIGTRVKAVSRKIYQNRTDIVTSAHSVAPSRQTGGNFPYSVVRGKNSVVGHILDVTRDRYSETDVLFCQAPRATFVQTLSARSG